MVQSIDFDRFNWYARRAATAYQAEMDIRRAFPDTSLVSTTSIAAHYMEHYLRNINSKLASATQISYDQREEYIDC